MVQRIVIIIVVIGAAAWFFLFLSKSEQRKVKKEIRSGASYLKYKASSVTDSSTALNNPEAARQCRENMARIESAKRAAADKLGISAGVVPLDAILREMGLSALPRCPQGGEYTVGPVNFPIKCSIGANGTTMAADDHILQGY